MAATYWAREQKVSGYIFKSIKCLTVKQSLNETGPNQLLLIIMDSLASQMAMTLKEQTGKNLVANITYLIINIVIGVFLTPYYVDMLGVAAYAVVPLTTSLIGYIGLFTDSLNSAVARHLMIDVQGNSVERANRTFNSALFGVSKLILILIPVVIVVSLFVPQLFGVPLENTTEATWLFIGMGLAFLLRAWSSSFTVTLYTSNRLDLINIINVINIVGQVSLIVALFTISTPSLTFIGASYALSAAMATALSVMMYKKMNRDLVVRYRHYDKKRFKEMAQMGGWIIINNIGSLLFLNIDLIVVNYLFGNVAGGEYAIAFQWVILLRSLAGTFISVIGPIILIAYANKQMDRIIAVSKGAVKLTSIGMALPIGLLCGLAPNVLTAWVGESFTHLAPLMILLLSHLVINTAVTPLFLINTALNKVRLPAIVTLVGGVGNLLLALFLASPAGWGIYGVAAAGLISLTLKNFFFTPVYASVVMRAPIHTFYPSIIPGMISMIIISLMSATFSSIISLNDLIGMAILAGSITITYLLFTWKFLLNDAERSLMPVPASIKRRLS